MKNVFSCFQEQKVCNFDDGRIIKKCLVTLKTVEV